MDAQHDSTSNHGSAPVQGKRRRAEISTEELFGKLPPAAVEAEMALLGCMILDASCISEVLTTVTSAEDFSRPGHGLIFSALVDLFDQQNTGDITILHQLLTDRGHSEHTGGVEYLLGLAESVPAATNCRHYARLVSEKAALRRAIGALSEGLHIAYECPDDPREAIDKIGAILTDVINRCDSATATELADLVIPAMEEWERSGSSGQAAGLKTGYTDLDEKLGGLSPGQVIVIGARPSVGKTSFALNIGGNVAARGNSVGIFSLEMTKRELTKRYFAWVSGINSGRLRSNQLTQGDLGILARTVGRLSELPIVIDDQGGISILQLRARARRMLQRHKIKLLIIDYLQLITGTRTENRTVEVGEISKSLKALAKELGIPIILLSQLNRQSENRDNRRPRISDLRESGAIEQDADVVILLHREDISNLDDQERAPDHIAEVIIAKQREGPTGVVRLFFDEQTTSFKNYSASLPPGGFTQPAPSRSPQNPQPKPPARTALGGIPI